MTRKTCFVEPGQNSKSPAPKSLTKEEQDKYDILLKHLVGLESLPVAEQQSETAPLNESEKSWLSKECLLRYLRATKWNVNQAIKRIEETIVWRRTFKVDPFTDLVPDLVSPENETGKEVLLGFDKENRPCLYLKPGKQNTKSTHRQVQHMVFMLERVIDMMVPGQDQLALLIDFKGRGKLPNLSVGREVLNILQNHYPERLGKALLTNIPKFGWIFLKLINPFIDPMTREKLVYQDPFENYVPVEQLDKDYGGIVDFEYDHKVYWPHMCSATLSRRRQYLEFFRQMGGEIGISEYEIRSHFEKKEEVHQQPNNDSTMNL